MDDAVHETVYKTLLQNVIEAVPIRIFWKDRHSRYLGCNSPFAHDAGRSSPNELIGKTDFDMDWKAQAERYRSDDKQVIESGLAKLNYEEPQTTPDGNEIWLRTSKVPLRDSEHNIIGILGIYEDITEQKQAEQNQKCLTRALKLLSKCNSLLVRSQHEQELLTDICRLIVETGGYRMAWVGFAGNDANKSVYPVARSGYDDGFLNNINISWADTRQGLGPTGTAIRTGKTVMNPDIFTNSTVIPWREEAVKRGYLSSISLPLKVDQHVLGSLNIYAAEICAFGAEEIVLLEDLARDLAFGIETLRTRIKHDEAEEKLKFLAHYDPLTGLPNRHLLADRFNQAVASADRANSNVAVLYLDLDNFKQINDSLGHEYGDRLLIKVTERLQNCLRKTDTVSRQGGDEFVILLNSVRNAEIIEEIAQGIMDAFAEPFRIEGYLLSASFSIGISLFPSDDQQFHSLLKHAETALYYAKESGRNTYRFFSEQMNKHALEHLQLQGELHNALHKKEFILHYQPQIDLLSGQIVGVEALIRWQHPTMGLIAPGKFIPLAERSGLIIAIGEWVLNEACRQIKHWNDIYPHQSLFVAVNLSAPQFKRGDLVDTVSNALALSGLPAHFLELELTESILLHDMDEVRNTLRHLKAMSVRFSIDDFGTGYSSFAYLKQLAVNKLKIDQSFVHDMVDDAGDAAIVKAIIQLGHTLELSVIAEGVENEKQLTLLKEYGCDDAQGYLFSKPLSPAEYAQTYLEPDTSH